MNEPEGTITMRQKLLEACAANLRDFGYPDAVADKVMTVPLFWMFASKMLSEHVRDQKPGYDVAQQLLDEASRKNS